MQHIKPLSNHLSGCRGNESVASVYLVCHHRNDCVRTDCNEFGKPLTYVKECLWPCHVIDDDCHRGSCHIPSPKFIVGGLSCQIPEDDSSRHSVTIRHCHVHRFEGKSSSNSGNVSLTKAIFCVSFDTTGLPYGPVT